jgi:RimJ/RimL family protein N-acetyltransferase
MTTVNFILRPWKPDDVDSLTSYANNFNVARFMTNGFPHPYTRENGKAFIEMATKNLPATIFAIDIEGKASGGIGLHPQSDIHCKNAELGYWLAEPFWGKGIVSRAIPQMLAYGFKTLDIQRIFARPFGTNTASQKVLQKSGFFLEARFEKTLFKNGEYLDELVYAVRKK